ncbi:hypothetical protein [Methylovulum psychrotolerans]|uniref:Tail fiber protein n=1 Tax=Methylovulum psychrotolerans TaxID=1704499 RepID=A0A1Z4C0F0_9GAMM|nr:hypothetical protein [Methylovulum psychrotolerans]ASF46990.1 hypothetical protein CEK71_13425 [Methylovulum psychrotolerans]
MAAQDYIDAIDPSKPQDFDEVAGTIPTISSVRNNFTSIKQAIQAVLDLVSGLSAPSLSSMMLTGIGFASSALIVATDNALVALGKLQAQISLRATIDSPALTGTPTAPTAPTLTSTMQIATTEFATLADAAVLSAAKTYTDTATTGLLQDCGTYDASGNIWPSSGGSGTSGAILKGDVWYLSVGGTLGGVYYESHTSIRALTDTPGQTAANWAVLEGAFGYVPENISNKSNSTGDIASTSKYPVWAILVSWANSVYQPINAKLSAIAALAATNGYAIVGNGSTFVLQLLGNAAGKSVGATSADVASGDRGLPSGGTTGQVLSKINSTDYNVQWSTVSAGSSIILGYALFNMNFQNTTGSSTVLTYVQSLSNWSNLTGFSPPPASSSSPANNHGVFTLPVGTFIIKATGQLSNGGINFNFVIADHNMLTIVSASLHQKVQQGGTPTSSVPTNLVGTFLLTLSGTTNLYINGNGVGDGTVAGTSFNTSSSACWLVFEVLKVN